MPSVSFLRGSGPQGLAGGWGLGAWAPWQPRERGGLVSLGSAGVGSEEVASQEVTLPLY